jgi:aryl-alcohol dehydrogenase-like predicted oxidoreductase
MSKLETILLAPELQICQILNGMWQTAGGHGQIDSDSAISEMMKYHELGFTTWDMADIYGPAEIFFGRFKEKIEKEKGENELSKIQGLTKFVPPTGPMSKSIVEHHVNNSIQRMNVKSIDLLQFHWWDYNNSNYINALEHLSDLQDECKIKHLGLTNFNTEKAEYITEQGFKLVSNQVQYSILDQRPEKTMSSFCQKNKIKLLTYGTLLGGFFSEKYLKQPEPTRSDLDTLSLQKYKNMIDIWGGWQLFQELLETLNQIAIKHKSSISNVATRFVLDKPAVAGVIIGARLGISEHRNDNIKVFEFELDSEDQEKIRKVTSKSNDLFEIIGDCGDEYR